MAGMNVIHHVNELKKVLAYSKNIGFFLGAGSSCAFGLPGIDALTNEVKSKLNSVLKKSYENAEIDIASLNGGKSVTIEDILNYLRQIRDLTKEKKDREYKGIDGESAALLDKTICQEIYKIIKVKGDAADIKELRKFFAWYDAATNGFIKEIFTTNYDMLLEMAMEANYIPYFDGFSGSYEPFFNPESIDVFPNANDSTSRWIRLWKIHGSLNWSLKEETSTSAKRVVRVSVNNTPVNEVMIYPSREKYALSRREPFIAYFDRLKKYMLKGELVFIFSGYSFSDQHINDIIFNALRQNPRLYVVVTCFLDEQVENMRIYADAHLNLCVMGPKKVVANGSIYDWIYDDSNEDSEGNEFYWNNSSNQLILGDFKNLINFLVDNSGRQSMIEVIANGK